MRDRRKCINCTDLILAAVICIMSLSTAGAQEPQIRVVDGVREIVYTESEPPAIDPYEVKLSLIFGTDQGEDTYFFRLPTPQMVTDDGVLYVVDARSTLLHWFGPDGSHLGMFGTKGEGPGEFQVLQDCIVDGGRLFINDPFLHRMNIFTMTGEFIESIPYSSTTVISPYITLYGPTDNRQFLIARPQQRREMNDARFRIIRHNEKLEAIDTPVEFTRPIETVPIGRSEVNVPMFVNILPEVALEVDLPAAWADGREFRVDFLDPVDLSRWAVTIPHKALPVTRALREDAIQSYSRNNLEEAARRNLRFADHLPHISFMSRGWDSSGRLWVQEYRDRTIEDSPYRHQVFSKDGTWLFRQDLPKLPSLITSEGFYTRGELEDGTPVVEFYSFIRR
ncbi:6-bladed beta-propeller [Gemmatimonadota bacterium]